MYSYRDLQTLVSNDEDARIVLYLENDDFLNEQVEYWQPFRGRFLVIVKAKTLLGFYKENPGFVFGEQIH